MERDIQIDDSILFDNIDELLANIDLSDLIEVKNELLKENKDTSIIDKAIKERKRRDEILKKEQKQIQEKEKNKRKMFRKATIISLLTGLTSNNNLNNDLMSWEEDAIKNNEYEPFNFEEEELEEDDYYFDDDK